MSWETVFLTLFITVSACAIGMGIAWYAVIDKWHEEKFENYGLLAEDYNREAHKARMDAYLARKELAEYKGVPFTLDPPERRVSVFEQYIKRKKEECPCSNSTSKGRRRSVMRDLTRLLEEIEEQIEKEERIAQRELRSCWGMPSGLEPPAFEEARARERMYKRWIETLRGMESEKELENVERQ